MTSSSATRSTPPSRVALIIPAGVALLAGLDAALMLLGLPAPVSTDRLPDVHGVLLVLGFVGTLISLERAVALGRAAGYLSPAFLGAGGLLLVSPAPVEVGKVFLVVGTAAMVALYVPLWRRQGDAAVLTQTFGAVVALGGALLWLGGVAVPALLPWLAGFVILTIAGERLELARLQMGTHADAGLLRVAASVIAAILASLLWPAIGFPLLGLALLILVGWLVSRDVARRTIHATGLPRFIAGCLLAGYGWLGVAGAVWLLDGTSAGGVGYDAVVHAVFLGFTISMIMAHAPVIFPAILRRPLPYHPAMIVPAALLHLSLALRLIVGDGYEIEVARQIGGALNVTALLLFVAVTVWSALRRTATPAARRPAQRRMAVSA